MNQGECQFSTQPLRSLSTTGACNNVVAGLAPARSPLTFAFATSAASFAHQLSLLLRHGPPIASKEFAPIFLLQLDAKLLRSLLDALPRFIPLFVRHILHLVEARYSFLNVTSIFERSFRSLIPYAYSHSIVCSIFCKACEARRNRSGSLKPWYRPAAARCGSSEQKPS